VPAVDEDGFVDATEEARGLGMGVDDEDEYARLDAGVPAPPVDDFGVGDVLPKTSMLETVFYC
jgi:hypothetical protein